jgi:hypothetical protein
LIKASSCTTQIALHNKIQRRKLVPTYKLEEILCLLCFKWALLLLLNGFCLILSELKNIEGELNAIKLRYDAAIFLLVWEYEIVTLSLQSFKASE